MGYWKWLFNGLKIIKESVITKSMIFMFIGLFLTMFFFILSSYISIYLSMFIGIVGMFLTTTYTIYMLEP